MSDLIEQKLHIDKPWGGEDHFTIPGSPEVLKVLTINEGEELSTQSHEPGKSGQPGKTETWLLLEGEVIIHYGQDLDSMRQKIMRPGVGYTAPAGLLHSLEGGKGGGKVIESSTSEMGGITIRHKDKYGRAGQIEDDEQRKLRDTCKI